LQNKKIIINDQRHCQELEKLQNRKYERKWKFCIYVCLFIVPTWELGKFLNLFLVLNMCV